MYETNQAFLMDNNHKTQFQIRKPNGIEMDYLYDGHQSEKIT